MDLLYTLVAEDLGIAALPAAQAHEIAKLTLTYAGTLPERATAVKIAMSLGMPLSRIEEYLDWLDANRP